MRLTKCSQRIYFDGYLPPSKLDVRLERLRGLTKRLNDYYHANTVPCRVSSPNEVANPKKLFSREPLRSSHTNLPPSPFLVPAIIDALGNSEIYSSVVEVVPGEADLYCAGYLKQHGGIVITGDSDLLVHDVGACGSVSFFKDIEALSDIKSGSLHSSIYHPASIADRLALPKSHGLRALAFEMANDSQGTFRRLLVQATALKAANAYGDRYDEFLKEYKSLPMDTTLATNNGGNSPRFMAVLRKLDPRISEYVLQFPSLARCSGQAALTVEPEMDARHVFLPFLLDCPVRTNAWEASVSLRLLAYGLVKGIVPENEQEYNVFEHRRLNDMSAKGLKLSNIPPISEGCTSLIRRIDQVHCKYPTLSVPDRWTAFVICQEVEWSSSIGRPVRINLISQQLAQLDHYTWDIVQFLAQAQGVFYSLRMLQQITSLIVSCHHASSFPEAVFILHDRLKSLPPLSDIPHLSSVMSFIGKIEAQGMVGAAHEILEIGEWKFPEIHQPSQKVKEQGKASRRLASTSRERKKPSNSFALLEVE
jgi:hypothetical protein